MLLSRFLKDRRGAVAPMFALAIVPVVGFVGASIDYSRANAARTAMQSALDATALAMAKLAPTLTQTQLQTQATAYFNAMYSRPEAKNVVVTPTYTTSGGSKLTVAGSASLNTAFMKLFGYSSLNIGSSSTVKWGMNRMRVALALDNTGSMNSDGKIGALKTATKNLISQLKAAATTNGDVYISIIPFNRAVNAGGLGNASSSWVRFAKTGSDTDSWNDNNGSCSNVNNSWWYQSKSSCNSAGGNWSTANTNTWNGCIMDRNQDHDVLNTTPTGNSKKFPAYQYSACPVEMMGLTYDWTALNNKVDSMDANGSTNQTIGLAWAWQSLTASPFTVPAKDANYVYSDVIILLSDGLNTQNRWDGNGSSVSTAVDSRMSLVCTNAKAAGMQIWTIHVNTDGDPTSTVLRDCASSTDKFYTVTSSGQIATVFNQIGTNLSKLRISN